MPDRLGGIAVFVEAVEAGGFAAAASRLNLSRSAVGKTVARLETRLGVRLFHRTTRTQSLTKDGQLYYERCLRALDELRAGEAMLESGRQEAAGRLRVSMPALFGRHCVAPILMDLARRHPKLVLELNFTNRLVDLVEDGFDLAIRNGPLRGGAGLMARRLFHQRMTICASPGYVQAHGAPQGLADLARHDAVIYQRTDHVRTWQFPHSEGSGTGGGSFIEATPRGRLWLDDLEAIADAAAAGMGLAWLPCWLIRKRVQAGELVRVLEAQPGLVLDTHAIWPQTPHLPMRVRLAIDTLAAELPKMSDP